MTYLMSLLMLGLVFGLVAVASNPSPYFAALGLVVVAGLGCGILVGHGGSFLSLVLFLIYLGGMLVVFAYSSALAAEPFPESWGERSVVVYVVGYLMVVGLAGGWFWYEWHEASWGIVDELQSFAMVAADTAGVAMMYSSGGLMLVACAWVLLLTLFVVLELTRGLSRGALRAV
uniref:NADH-ubiquinone oxidoreductase chain 6 n=1 Tax=Diaphus theta TaxID=91653 RepID=L8AY49_9TELE|nr:NADH dehydrogenase subunit 6 [Diaphus theta]UZN43294.1 NADH dehydrogenase subunit 6 [Diaphus theta]WNH24444.1 NADH dehydrogenase subunit 6 [Diaphus theta]BAM74847.1 NADH dehydrogenase subunit 6 [Diaphus theta]